MKGSKIIVIGMVVLVISMGMVSGVSAQNSHFGVYGALSMPMADFGDDSGEKAGYASTGFGGGLELSFPVGSGFSVAANASGIFNKMDLGKAEDFFGDAMDVGYWMNIPVMIGLKYEPQTSSSMALYGIAQAGVNIVRAPTMEMRIFGVKTEFTSDAVTSFGFGVGGGAVINERFTIGVRYLSLGEPEIKYTTKSGGYSTSENFKQPVSMFLVTLGISF